MTWFNDLVDSAPLDMGWFESMLQDLQQHEQKGLLLRWLFLVWLTLQDNVHRAGAH